jgi:hypothetical protein
LVGEFGQIDKRGHQDILVRIRLLLTGSKEYLLFVTIARKKYYPTRKNDCGIGTQVLAQFVFGHRKAFSWPPRPKCGVLRRCLALPEEFDPGNVLCPTRPYREIPGRVMPDFPTHR